MRKQAVRKRNRPIALVVACAVAAPAFAQSNVTIYGLIDYGLLSRSGSDGALPDFNGQTEFASGVEQGSRLGFRGSENLGDNLKAIYEIEFALKVDQGTNTSATWGNRHSWVGLAGDFGTLVGGRVDAVRYGVIGKYDPFASGTVGNAGQLTVKPDRTDNSLLYISPSLNGLNAVLSYSANIAGTEGANNNQGTPCKNHCFGGNDFDNRLMTASVNYANGPLSVSAVYEQIETVGISNNRFWATTFGGSYDFGAVKLSALYDIVKSESGVTWDGVYNPITKSGIHDEKYWMIGLKAPIGNSIVTRALYVKSTYNDAFGVKNVKGFDASKWAVGADYFFSKRTNLYFDYAQIDNDDNGLTALSFGGSASGPSAVTRGASYGIRGFDLGIRHKF
jgi:predicted porin